jgi:hypothetical protein
MYHQSLDKTPRHLCDKDNTSIVWADSQSHSILYFPLIASHKSGFGTKQDRYGKRP